MLINLKKTQGARKLMPDQCKKLSVVLNQLNLLKRLQKQWN